MGLTESRPRPRLDTGHNPAGRTDEAEKLEAIERLIGESGSVVPKSLGRDAEGRRKRDILAARAKAAKLDILAKRRTDDARGADPGGA